MWSCDHVGFAVVPVTVYALCLQSFSLICLFLLLSSAPILISVQAFLLDSQVVPLSMTHQSLYVTVETQVLIAGLILAGVYVLIIFEVKYEVSVWRHYFHTAR